MKIRIRRYRAGDRKAVLAAFRSNVPAYFPASEESWLRSCLDEPDGPLFVVVDGDQPRAEALVRRGYACSDGGNTRLWQVIETAPDAAMVPAGYAGHQICIVGRLCRSGCARQKSSS